MPLLLVSYFRLQFSRIPLSLSYLFISFGQADRARKRRTPVKKHAERGLSPFLLLHFPLFYFSFPSFIFFLLPFSFLPSAPSHLLPPLAVSVPSLLSFSHVIHHLIPFPLRLPPSSFSAFLFCLPFLCIPLLLPQLPIFPPSLLPSRRLLSFSLPGRSEGIACCRFCIGEFGDAYEFIPVVCRYWLFQLDELIKSTETAYASEEMPKDVSAAQTALRQHNDARSKLQQLIDFTSDEADQIVIRVRQQVIYTYTL